MISSGGLRPHGEGGLGSDRDADRVLLPEWLPEYRPLGSAHDEKDLEAQGHGTTAAGGRAHDVLGFARATGDDEPV